MIGLVRQGRALGAVIIAASDDHAAVRAGTGGIGVLEDVAATIDPGSLAVPHPEHAVVPRPRVHVDLLGAPERRRRQVLV